jgi:hypothetical protein
VVLSHTTTGALAHDRWGSSARSGGAQTLEYSVPFGDLLDGTCGVVGSEPIRWSAAGVPRKARRHLN